MTDSSPFDPPMNHEHGHPPDGDARTRASSRARRSTPPMHAPFPRYADVAPPGFASFSAGLPFGFAVPGQMPGQMIGGWGGLRMPGESRLGYLARLAAAPLQSLVLDVSDRLTSALLAFLRLPSPLRTERPDPRPADRIVLPMSSGVCVLPNCSAQITSRPQNLAFKPGRIVIGGDPAHWIVNEIKVGNRSQLAQSGDLPGEMFSADAVDCDVSLETVQTAMDFVLVVTYVGPNKDGEPFVCGVVGLAAT